MTGLELLKQQFNGHVAFRERRLGVLHVLARCFTKTATWWISSLMNPLTVPANSGSAIMGSH